MSLGEKVFHAQRLVNQALAGKRAPVIMSSFGKDSMVLLHLLRMEMGLDLPVLFHREPFFPRKYRFANRIIDEWNLTVYDYRPHRVSVVKHGGAMEVMNEYQTGGQGADVSFNYLPTGVTPPVEGQAFLCGLKDLLLKPLGNFNFPWDAIFVGHKATDRDVVNGAIPVQVDVLQNPLGADTIFPLREFTDADIWEYHESYGVPVHEERYDAANGYAEFADKSENPDYFECCTLCFDRDQPAVVTCPKTGLKITNLSSKVRYMDPPKLDYFATSKE